jgi:hypothetical protein
MAQKNSVGTGTLITSEVVDKISKQAGFEDCNIVGEIMFYRLYRLDKKKKNL